MHKIYTYGYQGSSPAALFAEVNRLGALLVDIRYSPHSQDPRWEQAAICELVGAPNYRWVQALGNRNYRGGPIELVDPMAGLRRLSAELHRQPIILLCACLNVDTCHRKVAAEFLARFFHVEVEHLSGVSAKGIPVLTLTQPWASLMALGLKKNETRRWSTPFRGRFLLHAGKGLAGMPVREFRALCAHEPFRSALAQGGYSSADELPRGVLLSEHFLVDCLPTRPDLRPAEPELSFGNYGPDRYIWTTERGRVLQTPIPARGALGIWTYEGPIEEWDIAGVANAAV